MGTKKIQRSDSDNDSHQNTFSKQFLPLIKVFVVGSISAIICAVILQPLDVIKTRLQTYHKTSIKENFRFRTLNLILHINDVEHIKMLWAGTIPTVVRGIPGGGIYFASFEGITNILFPDRQMSTLQSVGVGMLARCITDTTIIPLTVMKTRMESGMYTYRGVFSGLRQIYINEGWRALTSGLLPVLVRDVPMSGVYILFYIQSEDLIPKDFRRTHPSATHTCSAVIAGILASLVTHPPDVIKTQMQLFPNKYKTLWSAVIDIWTNRGILGYFDGLVPRLMKRTIFGAISWTLYEKVKEHKPIN